MSSVPLEPKNWLDTQHRVRLAVADASGAFLDEQLQRMFRLSAKDLREHRDHPDYQRLVAEQTADLQSRCALLYFEFQLLGPKALENAKSYLDQRQDKHNWDVTKFVLEKLLPDPAQRHEVHHSGSTLNVEAVVFLNEKLPGLAESLRDQPAIDIEVDPRLSRPNGHGNPSE